MATMQDDSFSQLEEKVLKAVRMIQDLKTENGRLRQQREGLEGEIAGLQQEHDRLSRELEEARQAAATVERFEESRRIIEEKVGGLLEKLDQIG
jgi:predicted  nucleic acid-binding Zn-ribbon protein